MNGILNANKHIAFFTGLSVLVTALSFGPVAHSASPHLAMLDIAEGDTSFLVNKKSQKVWWVVGECRRPIEIEKGKKSNNSMTSKMMSKDVRIGSHPVTLRQQFRFTLSADQTSLEVYNSMRGGWSPVSVTLNETCSQDTACRARMELPEC